MGLTVYRRSEVDRSLLSGATVAVVGYGNQGHAHALNLRDSGVRVVVGQRPGRGFDRAAADGFQPLPVGEAVAGADWVILTLPDETAADVFARDIAPALKPRTTLGFVHGFNLRFGFIAPPPGSDVIMVAPKGPGALLRSLYAAGKGLPALAAVAQDASGRAFDRALAWADAIGSTRAGVLRTTFAEETETDLFGEQVVLCGGVSALTQAAFETLVEAGYTPEFAYLECVHELKQIVDLLYERGLTAMRDRISNTAEYGDLTRGPRVIGPEAREQMKQILEEIRSGRFAAEWLAEARGGGAKFKALHEADSATEYERAGQFVRSLMPWLADKPA
ncbi:MAG: ketol-acid reductoisomerase [Phycisphaerales bacterium]|nr:ketol-acid reductoisomerase [Phycisphaerales bacterium]